MSKGLRINQVAILGAGVMGAQIAAHFVNVGIKAFLFDLPSREHEINYLASQSIKELKKLKPNPLALNSFEQFIQPANYETDLHKLSDCDLIIEAISEKFEWKKNLYEKISPFINESTILASNTSGLSINKLSQSLPENLKSRFFGVHFFNPPRYMKLIELILSKNSDIELSNKLEEFLVVKLGKGVVRAKDTPNFIGNRVGVFSLISILHHAETFNLPSDLVDALTGEIIGRPKSATFRTLDIVGLDTYINVVGTMEEGLSNDPWHKYFVAPKWINDLVGKGALGAKARAGIYKKIDNKINVLDLAKGSYRPVAAKISPEVLEIFQLKNPLEKFKRLKQGVSAEARFLWAHFRDLLHYCCYHLKEIANDLDDLDLALNWGYGWKLGPFENWQRAGWHELLNLLEEDINTGNSMSDVKIPDWVRNFGSDKNLDKSKNKLPFYNRQITKAQDNHKIIFENDFMKFWTMDNNSAIATFKTKRNTISFELIESLLEAVNIAEKDYKALILWQENSKDFSLGANLQQVISAITDKDYKSIEFAVSQFQNLSQRLKYSSIPTITAISGMVLGGACEFVLHTDKTVASLESYIGLVEAGVGILPAGAGTKELAKRASLISKQHNVDLFKYIENNFMLIAKATVSQSAVDAKEKGFLKPADLVVANKDEILFVAHKLAESLYESNYSPQFEVNAQVLGKNGIANFNAMLTNMLEGNFISEHDYFIANKIAYVICGGEVDNGSFVDDNWLLRLEREAFIELLKTEKTQQRIKYTLETGKPLRN